MIIGIAGNIGCGKDTVASYLTEHHYFRRDSFAASVKDTCSAIFGWPRHLLEGDSVESRNWRDMPDLWWEKKLCIDNFTPRLAMQLMATDVLRNHFNPDIWFMTLENRLRQSANVDIVISDVRFPNEIQFVKDNHGIVIHVRKSELPSWFNIAASANAGCSNSKYIMETTYSTVHYSEWAHAGAIFDYTLFNSGSLDQLYVNIEKMIALYK